MGNVIPVGNSVTVPNVELVKTEPKMATNSRPDNLVPLVLKSVRLSIFC